VVWESELAKVWESGIRGYPSWPTSLTDVLWGRGALDCTVGLTAVPSCDKHVIFSCCPVILQVPPVLSPLPIDVARHVYRSLAPRDSFLACRDALAIGGNRRGRATSAAAFAAR